MNSTVDRQKELNEKIAELLGLQIGSTGYDQYSRRVLNYSGDLNAMHEAEKMLNAEQRNIYADHLFETTPGANEDNYFPVWECTALQRAEAFVKTMEATSVQKP